LSEATHLQKCNYNDLLEGMVTRELPPYDGGRALLTRLAHCQAGGVRDV
jgi:hypothetical protein